jgi:uncharacterized repeat protein (TIGR03803 family)
MVSSGIFSFNTTNNTATPLYTFEGRPDAARGAVGSLVQSGPELFGMTPGGGANGDGAIFSYSLATSTESVVYSFAGGPNDGNEPLGSLIASGNELYGTTANGGSSGAGTIFSFDTTTGLEEVLRSGIGGSQSALILVGDVLYGTAGGGGVYGDGSVFSYDLDTGAYDILHSFGGADGRAPDGNLLLVDNELYGMTQVGGTNDDGVIFSI